MPLLESSFLESRQFRRFSIHAPCLVRSSRAHTKKKVSPIVAETRDISRGGLCFEASAEWNIGTEFQCAIELPLEISPDGIVKLQCRCKVVRVVRLENNRIEVGATIEHYTCSYPQE